MPGVTIDLLKKIFPRLATLDPRMMERVAIEGMQQIIRISEQVLNIVIARYDPFLRRQEADLREFATDESLDLDPHLDYNAVEGLSSELRERLGASRPTNIVRTQISGSS